MSLYMLNFEDLYLLEYFFVFTYLSHCSFILKQNGAILIKRCSNITFWSGECFAYIWKKKSEKNNKRKGKKKMHGLIFSSESLAPRSKYFYGLIRTLSFSRSPLFSRKLFYGIFTGLLGPITMTTL